MFIIISRVASRTCMTCMTCMTSMPCLTCMTCSVVIQLNYHTDFYLEFPHEVSTDDDITENEEDELKDDLKDDSKDDPKDDIMEDLQIKQKDGIIEEVRRKTIKRKASAAKAKSKVSDMTQLF